MKRYSQQLHLQKAVFPLPAGEYVLYTEAQSTLADLRALVERVEHSKDCLSKKLCGVAGCGFPPWSFVHQMADFRYMHEFEPGKCNCPRGEVLAKLAEVMK